MLGHDHQGLNSHPPIRRVVFTLRRFGVVSCALVGLESVEERSGSPPRGFDGALGGGEHQVFEFGEDMFD
jgi:hypothetical protein